MRQYLNLLQDVISNGELRPTRAKLLSTENNVSAYSVFGRQARFDLREGFPLLTTKKVSFRSIAVELLWFLRGETNIEYLKHHGVSIWNEWVNKEGDLGPVYGHQWRRWGSTEEIVADRQFGSVVGKPGIDQISQVIESLKKDPYGRRHIVSAWNVADLPKMALPPCHLLFQFYVSKGQLSCHMYQRSADVFLGVPYNVASYALLTHIIAQVTGYSVGELIISFGDLHLYENHIPAAQEQLTRPVMPSPKLQIINPTQDFRGFIPSDFSLLNYTPHPSLPAEVAV